MTVEPAYQDHRESWSLSTGGREKESALVKQ